MNQIVKDKVELKVYVRMHDGERLLGYVFVSAQERLQDIMNDGRMFIPVHVDDQSSRALVMLSKRYIQQIEEVGAEAIRRKSPEVAYDRRSGEDRRQGGDRRAELRLELDDLPYGRRKDD